MPINKETIISVFDDKLTLMQWLKTINKALEDAVLTGVTINKKGNATLSFVFTFEDGTTLETDDLILQQGESINGVTIRNGHLYLSLTNGDTLDAGNLKPVTSFTINESQHLIVNYGDGTSQDLGAIFSGNVNINGNFTADSIIENMSGYSYEAVDNFFNISYAGAVKNGNKLTLALAGTFTRTEDSGVNLTPCYFLIPKTISNKLYNNSLGALDNKQILFMNNTTSGISKFARLTKASYVGQAVKLLLTIYNMKTSLEIGTSYEFRYEVTFLLSDNLAG